MQMLEHYLHAIAFWLPNDRRGDIIAEISEDLNAQIDEQRAILGRTLSEDDLEALLQRRGRPVLVANGYQPQRYLIGPVWLPAYVFVLKVVGLCYVVPWLVVLVIVSRVQHPEIHWSTTSLAVWGSAWTISFSAAGVVTLIFTLLQRADAQTHFLENWNPRHLPPARDPDKILLSNSIAELVANSAFLFWWIVYAGSPFLFNGSPLDQLTQYVSFDPRPGRGRSLLFFNEGRPGCHFVYRQPGTRTNTRHQERHPHLDGSLLSHRGDHFSYCCRDRPHANRSNEQKASVHFY